MSRIMTKARVSANHILWDREECYVFFFFAGLQLLNLILYPGSIKESKGNHQLQHHKKDTFQEKNGRPFILSYLI